jgi:hypothetical protein
MRRQLLLFAALAGGLSGCTEAPVTVPLRSLERSGEVAFVCAGPDRTGRDIDECPDFEGGDNRLLALVTQTLRGEVAVVDLSRGGVLDFDRASPGFDFLPIGANPIDIVSTPGGSASFVGVGEVGKEGIFALPTTCIRSPLPDLTSWPACALPAAPGDMAIVIDPQNRAACDILPAEPGGGSAAPGECPFADLSRESSPPGRRKLVVSVPALGAIAILDAQAVLDRPQGSFDPCPVERWIELRAELPTGPVTPVVPDDLKSEECAPPNLNFGPAPDSFTPLPGGFALADTTLYIADRGAPVVHVLDLADPCAPARFPALLPASFDAPGRIVTTSRVAVSPITSKGQRFVYAIDELEGSVMAFDVTPGSTQRTPIVRAGAPQWPFNPGDRVPDRIAFDSPARDLVFALRDVPIVDPSTGAAAIGTFCDPISPSPGAAYRPTPALSRGAGPRELRGVFGFIALANGQVAVIDVEDFDAPCRRPKTKNSAPEVDFRGCASDPATPEFYTEDHTEGGRPTVTDEASCLVVQPHRPRSAAFFKTTPERGVRAPALRTHPQLSAPTGGALPTNASEEGRLRPKLLAVDFEDPEGGTEPAMVYVGTTLFRAGAGANPLVLDPAQAERPSVALMFTEPRAHPPEDELTLTYEGALVRKRATGFLQPEKSPPELFDPDANFCSRGVEDVALAAETGAEHGASDPDAFGRRHADFVQIVSELRGQDDPHWTNVGSCGGQRGAAAALLCRNTFGSAEAPSAARELLVREAYQNRLVIEPRHARSEGEKAALLDLVDCCFRRAGAVEYEVRGGRQWVLMSRETGFRHNVRSGGEKEGFRCVRDRCPRRRFLKSRVFEISSQACKPPGPDDPPPDCAIGPRLPEDAACVLPSTAPVTPGGPGSECIFQSLTHRFVVYRGAAPSERGMAFVWQTAGGFITLSANLAAQTAAVSPQSLVFVPQIGQLAVVDGAAEGLVLVSLDAIAISRLFF